MSNTVKDSHLENITVLLSANREELLSVLGFSALPLIQSATETLLDGRGGSFSEPMPAVLGIEFSHQAARKIALCFLSLWSAELRLAICGNQKVYSEIQKHGLGQLDLAVAAVAGMISAAIPRLAEFSGVVIVLGVLVVKSGVQAFCKMLPEDVQPTDQTKVTNKAETKSEEQITKKAASKRNTKSK